MDLVANVILVLMLGYFHQKIYRSPTYGLAFWLLFLVCHDILNFKPVLKLGLNIEQHDIVFMYFSYVSKLRYDQLKNYIDKDVRLKFFLLFLVFIVVSIPFFAIIKGQPVVSSINSARGFLLFLPAFTYFFSFSYNKAEIDKLFNLHFSVAIAIGVVTLALQLSASDRVVAAHGSLFFALTAIITLNKYYGSGNNKYLLFSLVLIALVVLLRFRSAWITLVFGLVYTHLYNKLNSRVIGIIFSGILVVFVFSIFMPHKYQKFADMLDESASPFKSSDNFENSTGGGRVARWVAQIDGKYEPLVLIWGLGHGYDRRIYFRSSSGDLRLSTVSFHNHYLEQIFRLGFISVITFIAFVIKFLRLNHLRQKSEKDFYMIGVASCLFGCLAFGMVYSFDYQLFILLGIGYSILIRKDEYSSDNTNI